MRKVVGIDRKIKRLWLDTLLDRLITTTDETELRAFLDDQLKPELPGPESRKKSVGILLRIWCNIPSERVSLRDRAIALLPEISGQERIWLHWGMAALAYPFFRDTAEVVGRLFSLQDDLTTANVQSRLVTTWGDRATIKVAAQKLVTMLADWEVLRVTQKKGHFLLVRKIKPSMPDLQLWLLEALLGASEAHEIEAQQLLRLPESFPFTASVGVSDLRKHEGFNIHRQGLDMDMVALRPIKMESLPKTNKNNSKAKPSKSKPPTLFNKQTEDAASGNGHVKRDQLFSISATDFILKKNAERLRVEESIKSEVLRTLSDRAARYLQVQSSCLIPDGPFAAHLVECVEQFRDGHYLGCIALTQAVLEAVIRHVWQVKLKTKPYQDGSFDKNLKALHKKKFISDEWKTKLDQMWVERYAFHHLRPSIECEQRNLEETARKSLTLLNELVREIPWHQIDAASRNCE